MYSSLALTSRHSPTTRSWIPGTLEDDAWVPIKDVVQELQTSALLLPSFPGVILSEMQPLRTENELAKGLFLLSALPSDDFFQS